MHIPDGLMTPLVIAIGWVLSFPVVLFSVRKVGSYVDEEYVPVVALLAAGIFVAQLLNFPVVGGTTGHLVGAALAVILLGPATAVLILTVILVIQSLLFGDGGLLALGLNILNMGVIGALTAWIVYRPLKGWNLTVATFLAAFVAVFLGAVAAATELGASYVLSGGAYGIPPAIAFVAMPFYHFFIGLGEGVITMGIVAYLEKVAPDLVAAKKIRFIGVPL
jgi:cobalt/nickel transport system permease protein